MPPYQRSTPTASVSSERGGSIYGVYPISQSTLVPKLKGVHLFGFDGAQCSQRGSFALAEKGLKRVKRVPWQSDATNHVSTESGTYTFRNVSLIKHHNLTEAYAAIQPNMVPPAFVHDGAVHVESMDIIDYLDQ